jgi:hypothetical protein
MRMWFVCEHSLLCVCVCAAPVQVKGSQYPALRAKIVSLITMDVHNRDVVAELIKSRSAGPGDFKWQSQLRCYFVVRLGCGDVACWGEGWRAAAGVAAPLSPTLPRACKVQA